MQSGGAAIPEAAFYSADRGEVFSSIGKNYDKAEGQHFSSQLLRRKDT